MNSYRVSYFQQAGPVRMEAHVTITAKGLADVKRNFAAYVRQKVGRCTARQQDLFRIAHVDEATGIAGKVLWARPDTNSGGPVSRETV